MMEHVLPRLPVEISGLHFNYFTVFNSFVVVLLGVGIFWLILRTIRKYPGKAQAAVEFLVSAFDNIICSTMGPRLGRRFLPLFGSLFLFIFLCNMLGLFPLHALTWGAFPRTGLEIGGDPVLVDYNDNGVWDPGEPFRDLDQDGVRANGILIPPPEEPTKDINLSLGVALWLAAIMYISTIAIRGFGHFVKGLVDPLPIMLPINLIGKVADVVSVSFRLFGNIFGGVVIAVVATSLIFQSLKLFPLYVLPIGLWLFFGLFVGTIQAFVYAMLWISYTANEIGPEEEDSPQCKPKTT